MSISRSEILQRKNALLRDLRAVHHHRVAMPGEMALSQRELSAKYGLSPRTVSIEMQKLIAEGVLYTVPRVGTFVGRPQAARDSLFLALFRYLKEPNIHWAAIQSGFEERIAALGGTSLVLDYETARRYRAVGEIVAPAGIFEVHDFKMDAVWSEPGTAHAEFGELHNVHSGSDAVYFDNPDGGWKATRHLLALGHQQIAFMALHNEQEDPGFFLWSMEREAGWRQALTEAGVDAESLVFRPAHTPQIEMNNPQGQESLHDSSLEVASNLLKRKDITAVVAVNAFAARGLFETLRAEGRDSRQWPAVVGFDADPSEPSDDAMNALTILRLPWEEIGREAADLLWARAHGQLETPQQRLVRMTLIPRLSCRQEWHRAPGATSRREGQTIPAA